MKRLTFALLLAGCGHTAAVVGPKEPAAPATDPAAFERGEDEILRDLAAIDRRFAKRAHVTPSDEDLRRVAMAAILHEDPTLAMPDDAIDPFSFDARARGLAAVKVRLASLPAGGGEEHELLDRVVDGEVARLDEERLLPRSASALVHAIVDTWTPPKDDRETADDDRWLARRLTELLAALTSTDDPNATLDVIRARELDDNLDALERIATGLPKTTQALVKLREGLERVSSQPAAKAHSDWELVEKRLRAQVGVTEDPDALAADLSKLEGDLRARAEAAAAASKPDRSLGVPPVIGSGEPALSSVDPIHARLLATGSCVDAIPGSRLRSMAAPTEREAICQLRKNIPALHDRALLLEVLHGHVVVAEWALDVARGKATVAESEAKHHLLTPPRFDVRARLERVVLARPATAIGAGVAVKLLVAGDPAARAEAWEAIGDVPLDIAARELH